MEVCADPEVPNRVVLLVVDCDEVGNVYVPSLSINCAKSTNDKFLSEDVSEVDKQAFIVASGSALEPSERLLFEHEFIV